MRGKYLLKSRNRDETAAHERMYSSQWSHDRTAMISSTSGGSDVDIFDGCFRMVLWTRGVETRENHVVGEEGGIRG